MGFDRKAIHWGIVNVAIPIAVTDPNPHRRLVAGRQLAAAVMLFGDAAKSLGSGLWTDVTLGGSKKFVTHHELSDRRRAQQRRTVVSMQDATPDGPRHR